MKKVYALSLGCPKNLVDTERFLADLIRKNYEVVAEPQNADILFLNTCAFISEAVTEAKQFLKELSTLKKQSPEKKFYVAGCLVSRAGKSLLTEFPGIDRLIPPEEITLLPHRFLCTPPHYAYLKVSEGCNNRCLYCLIPSLRGPLRSYPVEKLIAEATALAAGGVKELNIVAQDTTGYGVDLYGKPSLDILLKEVCKIDGLRWVRLLYTYPAGYSDKLIKTLSELAFSPFGLNELSPYVSNSPANDKKLCPYLDIPLQHASDKILKAMGRRGNRKEYHRLIRTLRSVIPELTLRTTFIVGFPGEDEEDFQVLTDFVREIEFEKLGLFTYSPEEGTPAVSLPNPVPEQIKEERLEKLRKIQAEISRKKLCSLINQEISVVVEGTVPEKPGCSWGRTAFDAPEVDGITYLNRHFPEGTFVKARVTGTEEHDLRATVLPKNRN
ncbi:MAG: radical SAM protein [Candidatus Omnitrophota bacterium]